MKEYNIALEFYRTFYDSSLRSSKNNFSVVIKKQRNLQFSIYLNIKYLSEIIILF